MLDVYALIYSQLSTLNIPTYPDTYPKALANSKVYPYIVFSFPTVFENNYADLNQMQIDVWSNTSNNVEVETITKSVDDLLKDYKQLTDNYYVKIYREKPYRLKLDEIEVQRRQLRYIVKIFRR